MIPCHPNMFKLKPNLLSGVKDRFDEEKNYDVLNRRKDDSVETCKPKYNELVLNKKKLQISNQNKKLSGNKNNQIVSLLSTNINIERGYNTQEASSCNDHTLKNNTNLFHS